MNRKNNIWSDSLIEESLCSDIGKFSSIGNHAHLIQVSNRDVESYEYSVDNDANSSTSNSNYTNQKLQKKNHLAIDNTSNDPEIVKIKNNELDEKHIVGRKLGSLVTFDESKKRDRIHASEIDTEDAVAKEIARYCQEDKMELICKRYFISISVKL